MERIRGRSRSATAVHGVPTRGRLGRMAACRSDRHARDGRRLMLAVLFAIYSDAAMSAPRTRAAVAALAAEPSPDATSPTTRTDAGEADARSGHARLPHPLPAIQRCAHGTLASRLETHVSMWTI